MASGAQTGSDWVARLTELRDRLRAQLWSREPMRPAVLGWLRNLAQLCIVIGQGFVKDQLLLRAHALTYLTLLSIIPLLALAVSLFEFIGGGSEKVSRLLVEQFAAGAPEAVDRIIELVRGVNFGALGTVGGAVLMATSILAIGNVEKALNAIWGVQKQRAWVRRIPDYLAVVIVTPLLLGVAISLGGSLESQYVVQKVLEVPTLAALYNAGLKQATTGLAIAGFSFLYWFLPNTNVKVTSALAGGVVAGLLFTVAQNFYISLSIGAARFDALFGGLSILPLLMVWVYFSWAIMLLGAEVAFALQTLHLYRREVRGTPPGPAAREALGLAITVAIARAFREEDEPWDEGRLSDYLDVPVRVVRDVVARLEEHGIVCPLADPARSGVYQLARPSDRITLGDVFDALRGPRVMPLAAEEIAAPVNAVFREIDGRLHDLTQAHTLRDLLDDPPLPQ